MLSILAPAEVFAEPFLKIHYNWHSVELKKKIWTKIDFKFNWTGKILDKFGL